MSDIQSNKHKKRLLFLSLDGVVHPPPDAALPRSWDDGVLPLLGIRFFHARPMRRIITLCEELDMGIVLTSSWRLVGFGMNEFNQVFKGLVVGLTSDLSSNNYQGNLREREIQAYLEQHEEGIPFAIVDSRHENFSVQATHFHITDPKELFSDELSAQIQQSLQ